MAGKYVGVQRGSIHQGFMEGVYPEAELTLYASQDEAYPRPGGPAVSTRSMADVTAHPGTASSETPAGRGLRLLR